MSEAEVPHMTAEEIVAALGALAYKSPWDREVMHSEADELLLQAVPPAVRNAYNSLIAEVGGFWYA